MHGARRWTLDTPRYTVFNRYIDEGSHGALPIESHRHLIPDDLYESDNPPRGAEKRGCAPVRYTEHEGTKRHLRGPEWFD